MIVSIHQPNFMPWLPYFKKIAMCDIFVVMIHCQFEKGGFQNRFNMNGKWHTMSVNSGLEPISAKKYVSPSSDWEKIKSKVGKDLSELDGYMSNSLWNTNYSIINHVAKKIGIKTRIELDYPTELTGTDRLLDICLKYGANRYIAGSSGTRYMDIDKFESKGVMVEVQSIKDEDKIPMVNIL